MGNIQISKLKPHPKNEYYFTDIEGEKYEEVKQSIETYGIREPIVITTNYTVISGHQRLRIANDLGFTEVPVDIKDVDEWEAEYLLIAYNTERRGEAEKDPIKKARQANFMREYWKNNGMYLEGRPKKVDNNGRTLLDVAEVIGETERTTKRLLKLNDLIPQLQSLVSSGKLGTTAAEQLAYLTVEEQTALFDERGDSIGDMTVEEVKKLRKEIETLRKENQQLKTENNELKSKVQSLESKEPEVIEREVIREVEIDKTDYEKLSKVESKLKETEKELIEYKEHTIKLHKENEKLKESDPYPDVSALAKIFIDRRFEILNDCHDLFGKINTLSLTIPKDIPPMVKEQYMDIFYKGSQLFKDIYVKLNEKTTYIEVFETN